jgi:hypothetical protein
MRPPKITPQLEELVSLLEDRYHIVPSDGTLSTRIVYLLDHIDNDDLDMAYLRATIK